MQHPLMIKNLPESWHKWNKFNLIKAVYDKPRANIILNGEKLKAFPLRAGTRQGCLMSPLFYQHSFESPKHSNQRTEAKGIQTGKKLKLCLWLT